MAASRSEERPGCGHRDHDRARESPDNISGTRFSRPRDDRGHIFRGRHNVSMLRDGRCTDFGVEEFEDTMEIKDEDINHFNKDDRGIYAINFLETNDKKDGTCE
eukprot:14309898-Heterocapsa_arctica.AAC.1